MGRKITSASEILMCSVGKMLGCGFFHFTRPFCSCKKMCLNMYRCISNSQRNIKNRNRKAGKNYFASHQLNGTLPRDIKRQWFSPLYTSFRVSRALFFLSTRWTFHLILIFIFICVFFFSSFWLNDVKFMMFQRAIFMFFSFFCLRCSRLPSPNFGFRSLHTDIIIIKICKLTQIGGDSSPLLLFADWIFCFYVTIRVRIFFYF